MGALFGRISIGAFWLILLINQIAPFEPQVSSWINWIGVILMAVHALECVLFRHLIAKHHHDNQTLGYVLVFLFGVLHAGQWLKQEQANGNSGPGD